MVGTQARCVATRTNGWLQRPATSFSARELRGQHTGTIPAHRHHTSTRTLLLLPQRQYTHCSTRTAAAYTLLHADPRSSLRVQQDICACAVPADATVVSGAMAVTLCDRCAGCPACDAVEPVMRNIETWWRKLDECVWLPEVAEFR